MIAAGRRSKSCLDRASIRTGSTLPVPKVSTMTETGRAMPIA